MESIQYMPHLEAAENGWIIRYSEGQSAPQNRPYDCMPSKECTEVFTMKQGDQAFSRFRALAEAYQKTRYAES